MKKLAKLAALAAGASMLLAPTASATHRGACGGDIGGSNGTPVVERGIVVDIGGAFYFDARAIADQDTAFSIWLYQEANGQPGLQRGNGATPEPLATLQALYEGVIGSSVDPCIESATPDAVIF